MALHRVWPVEPQVVAVLATPFFTEQTVKYTYSSDSESCDQVTVKQRGQAMQRTKPCT